MMGIKQVRMVALIGLGMTALSGCATTDVATRNAPFEALAEAVGAEAPAPSMKVVSYEAQVPETLRVSEANSYYPAADIVWRGEPLGDRHQQVKKIFDEALARGTKGSKGEVPVLLEVEVHKFHALTEKARYTIGGRHEIIFVMHFLDPKTREPVAEPRRIDATFEGFGGARAIAAERNGITQRKRIEDHLTAVFRRELGIGGPSKPNPVKPDVVSRNAVAPLSGNGTGGLF